MPDYPVLLGENIIRVFERLGFEWIRQRGSHAVMRRGGPGYAMPLHREVKRGALAGITRQSGIAPDEFIAALTR